jgi:hypothetical protein
MCLIDIMNPSAFDEQTRGQWLGYGTIRGVIMKFSIEQRATGLRIDAQVAEGQRQALQEELAKCASGTYSCPSTQYEKLQSIEITPAPEGVVIDLKAKPGETVDASDVQRCLEHTAGLIRR